MQLDIYNNEDKQLKKLTKDQAAELDRLLTIVGTVESEFHEALGTFNASQTEAFTAFKVKLDALNNVRAEAEELRAEIHQAMSDFFEEKPESWEKSEAGIAFTAWRESYDASIEPLSYEEPEDLEPPDCDLSEVLEALPREPD